MWSDNETDVDFLNFDGVAKTVASLVIEANGQPISIGVSGAWGVGKSSMIRLTQTVLRAHEPGDGQRHFVFVEFNAWLYQGYDDARAALLDVIATKLTEEAETRQTGLDKVANFLKRVRWLRVAKLIAAPAAAMALGVPPIGLLGGLGSFTKKALTGDATGKELEEADKQAGELGGVLGELLAPEADTSPPKEIQALRDSFEEVLDALNVTLVVLIDDLDRCLPETTISTLEAIRLFLFLENTAFVIAADDEMIKFAVAKHFEGLDDRKLVTNYFDKLIQVPIKVPSLGTQEVRAYMMMLFVGSSDLSKPERDRIHEAVAGQLRKSWQGARVDRGFIQSLGIDLSPDLIARLDMAERLAPLMATASGILGNPRLVKRFMNALSIRMTISTLQGVGVNEAVLAKLLLFERLAPPAAYSALTTAVTASESGHASFLVDLEAAAIAGEPASADGPWSDPFVWEWLGLPPSLGTEDLRGALYVSREHAPVVYPEDRLSSLAADVLKALLESPAMGSNMAGQLGELAHVETALIMQRLLDRARQEQEWGSPPILDACITLARLDASHGDLLASFLLERPVAQIQASIVPKIGDEAWSAKVFDGWEASDVGAPVKAAIKLRRDRGNLAK